MLSPRHIRARHIHAAAWWRSGRARRIGVGAVCALLVLAVAAGWLVFYSRVLGLEQIDVRGSNTLSNGAVREILAIPVGTPLARVDIGAAESILEGIAQVETATVTRGWPNTLVVRLVERSAVAAVDVDGTGWLIDRHGVLFAQVSALPEATVVLQVERAGPDDRATIAALEVIDALDPELRALLIRVRATSPTAIELDLLGDRTVIWGGPEGSVRKSQVLTGLLAAGVQASVYDVSSPTSAVVR